MGLDHFMIITQEVPLDLTFRLDIDLATNYRSPMDLGSIKIIMKKDMPQKMRQQVILYLEEEIEKRSTTPFLQNIILALSLLLV